MFTPQKVWSGFRPTPNGGALKTGNASGLNLNHGVSNHNSGDGFKGKSVTFGEPTTPFSGSMVNNGETLVVGSGETALDREMLLQKISNIEKELEKAYHEILNENAEIKFTSDSKLAEANALAESIEEKSLEVESKLRASDAKLAEVNRRSAEADRKLQDLEIQENAMRRDRLSFNAEKESKDSIFSKQREDLWELGRNLQDRKERLKKAQNNISKREVRATETDRIFNLKEKDLEEAQKKIDASNIELDRKETDISCRLANMNMKEKESEAMKSNLEVKEQELLELQQKLNAGEEAEIQKLLDDHNAVLATKKLEFEFEFAQKRKALEEELKTRKVEVERKEVESKHSEEKVGKREQAVEKRLEKFREKEENYDLKFKALSERERSTKTEEKKLEAEGKQLLADIEKLISLKAETEKMRTDNEEQILKLREGRDHLKISESERFEYLRLQSKLKQEIDDYGSRQGMLMKESEDLKQQKEAFEREWEELDEKRAEIEIELREVMLQKEEVEKMRRDEEVRSKNERQVAEEYIQREKESLKLAQESFEATMDLERSDIAEKLQSNRSQMLHEFELQKRELDSDMQNHSEEMDQQFRKKQQLFNEEKERELENVSYLRDVARREMEEMKLERFKLEKERQEDEANMVRLEKQRVEIRNDIDELFRLSGKLKDRQEQLIKERDRLISFAEKQKSCKNCLEMASEFVLSDLQPLAEAVNVDSLTLRGHPDDQMGAQELQLLPSANHAVSDLQNNEVSPVAIGLRSHASGGTVSWLRKCTSKILKFSPVKKTESLHQPVTDDVQINWLEPNVCTMENDTGLSFAIVSDSIDIERLEASEPSADNESNINSKVPEEPQPSELRGGQQKLRKKGKVVSRSHSIKAVIEDAKSILGNGAGSNHVNAARRDEFHLADKKLNNVRKQTLSNSSNIASENHGGESEGCSDNVVGRTQKRRQRVAPEVQTPGKARYNLRRQKTAATEDSTQHGKGNEEVADGIRNTEEVIHYSEVLPAPSLDAASDNGSITHFVQCRKAVDFLDKNLGRLTNDNLVLSEEVDEIPEGTGESGGGDEYQSESLADDDDQMEDNYEELGQHPVEVSIREKLWTIFTT